MEDPHIIQLTDGEKVYYHVDFDEKKGHLTVCEDIKRAKVFTTQFEREQMAWATARYAYRHKTWKISIIKSNN